MGQPGLQRRALLRWRGICFNSSQGSTAHYVVWRLLWPYATYAHIRRRRQGDEPHAKHQVDPPIALHLLGQYGKTSLSYGNGGIERVARDRNVMNTAALNRLHRVLRAANP